MIVTRERLADDADDTADTADTHDPAAPTTPPRPRAVRRLRWLLPAVLLVVWLAIAAVGGPYQGKLAEVQRNDLSSFLPEKAESTKAVELQKSFQAQQTFPAFLLLESGETLTPDQLAAFRQFATAAPRLGVPLQGPSAARVGAYLVPGPVPVVPAQDGRAALAILNFDADQAFGTL